MLYLAYERQANALQAARTAGGSALRALSSWDRVTGRPLRYAAAASALMQPFDRRAPTARMHLRVCALSGWNLLQLLR